MALFLAAALLNVFGQRSETSVASGPEARLELRAPSHLRGGVVFEARFEVHALRNLDHPRLILAGEWMQGVTLNTVEPAPVEETSRDGSLVFEISPLSAGETGTLWTQWQVNPTGFGRRDGDVSLYDGADRIATIERTTTVFP